MGAFSFNIACDMIDRFDYDPRAIKKYMDSMQAKRHKKSTYCKYLSTFDWNHNHPKIRQMKIKILKQLEYAYIGKPFKTNNFITY
jgi:predicted Zn-dependent protease